MDKFMWRARFFSFATILFLLGVHSAFAQSSTDVSTAELTARQQAQNNSSIDVSEFMQSQGKNTGHGAYQSSSYYAGGLAGKESDLPQPYGANLFIGGFEAARSDGLNDAYLIAPGDKISVQLWGTVNNAEVLTVDNQGNIFIAEIGPIKISNTPASELNSVVTGKIKSIYTNNVNVYVNLLTATPVSVYVAGPVLRPGQYAGLPSDSLLYFLKRAGGIDALRGSYRHISVLRDDKVIQNYDLYDFLREGKLASISFKDADVILISEQGPTVTVDGAARYPFRFELDNKQSKGEDLTYYARPLAKVSHVGVIGDRADGPVAMYFPLSDFDSFLIGDGDIVTFNDDLRPDVISVEVSGSYLGPSFYTLNKSSRLLELLNFIAVDPEQADIKSIYIKRKSVALQQKALLEESLQRLERSIFTAPASSDGEARIRAQEAEMVMKFVERARKIEPLGKVVLSSDGNVANIRLEQGDEVVIPLKTDLVQVSGEVLMPQAIVFNSNANISDYIAWAGGFTERADAQRIAIVHLNGLMTFSDIGPDDGWFTQESQQVIETGDQILVLPRVDSKTLQAVKDITQVIYQIAVAANVAIRN
jgi:protein involved in polysaccharide export with SLBB domain